MTRILHHRALPWLTGAGLFVLVLFATLTATPRYRSKALLKVETSRGAGQMGELLSSVPGGSLLGLGRDEIETQVGVLRSRRVLDAVMDSLGLDVTLVSPRPDGAALFTASTNRTGRLGTSEVEGQIVLRASGNGAWSVSGEELRPAITLPASIATGGSFQIGPHTITLAPDLAAREITALTFAISPRFITARVVESRLDVRRQSAGAQLIALTFDDPDPSRAAEVLARVLGGYLEFTARSARGDAGTAVAELRRQVAEQRTQLASAEDALRRYQEQTGLVLPEEQAAAQVKRYATLRGTLDQLEVERAALARLVALVESRASRDPNSAAYRQLATFPSLISNRAIQDRLLALLELENDRSRLMMVRSAENPDVRRLSTRITEVETDLQRTAGQYLESLDEQIAPTREAMERIDAEMGTLPERELRFLRLYRERTLLNEGYLALQQQLRITEVQDALRMDEVRIVDTPIPAHPDDPYYPRVPVNLALGLILALAAGAAVAALQSALRATDSGILRDA